MDENKHIENPDVIIADEAIEQHDILIEAEALEEEEEELYKEPKGDEIYGTSKIKSISFTMAGGGSHWYNYIIHFNERGEQEKILREDITGTREVEEENYAFINSEGGTDYIFFERDDYELGENENRLEWYE